ncbi:hypothetical protein IFR05_009115 [Cadophora sp. M221]|nr:hypothetical protein IFR05_009115 [Cadophora sp. M221]
MATTLDTNSALESRLIVVKSILPQDLASLLTDAVHSAHAGDANPSTIILLAIQDLEKSLKLTSTQVASLKLANEVAEITGDNIGLVKAIDSDQAVNSLREFALHYQVQAIANKIDPTTERPSREDEVLAQSVTKKLFEVEPTATVEGLVKNDQITLQDPKLRASVLSVLDSKSDFNISTTPITSAVMATPTILANVPAAQRDDTIQEIKVIQKVQAIAPVPEAIPVLMERNLTTAGAIAATSEANMVSVLGSSVGPEVAKMVFMTAKDITLRNESVLMSILGSVKGTGLGIIDGPVDIQARTLKIKAALRSKGIVSPNFESLFESNDQCIYDECTTVYSMSSYLCDILQYFRTSSAGSTSLAADTTPAGTVSIQSTVLEKLLSRRPDIANLELSCDNTNTIIPYIDLANEVMESFIVHLDTYTTQPLSVRKANIEAWNVSGESSSDLTSQPQHTNFDAYASIASAVYPFTIPYHQAIDTQRVFLDSLDIDRVSLLDNFRSQATSLTDFKSPEGDQHLRDLQREALDRQVDAEALGMIQEEYIILTGEAFWPKEYFDLIGKATLTPSEYSNKIGVKAIPQYYGYSDVPSLQSSDDSAQTGLKYVKSQFLKRTGITWEDIVEIVQTSFANPGFPKGRDKEIMDSLQFSYSFLQTLVDPNAVGWRRYTKVADYLIQAKIPNQWPSDDGCECMCENDIRDWVYANFEALGNIIVLDSNQSPELDLSGYLSLYPPGDPSNTFNLMDNKAIGKVTADGKVTDSKGNVVGSVDINSRVMWGSAADQKTIVDVYPNFIFTLTSDGENTIAVVNKSDSRLVKLGPERPGNSPELVQWQLDPNMGGTCNIDSMTLSRLNGTDVSLEEFNCLQKFIRLWKRLQGWSITEVDMALTGSDATPILNPTSSTATLADENEAVVLDDFSTPTVTHDDYLMARDRPPVKISQIDPATMHRLSCIKSIATLSGLSTEQVLTFWVPLPSRGTESLYWKLFFTRNLPGNKTSFKPDSRGDYFTGTPSKISDNALMIMAAFNLKAADLGLILSERLLGISDLLSMGNLTKVYRCTLLSKVLSVQIKDLVSVFHVFENPVESPETFLAFLQDSDLLDQASITFPQLDYALGTTTEFDGIFGPNRKQVLRTAKTLYDAMKEIEELHRDLRNDEDVPLDLVKDSASLVFNTNIVSKIEGLLEGTSIYSTNAPVGLELFEMSAGLSKKLKYAKNNQGLPLNLQVTGILTVGETEEAKALVNVSKMVPEDRAVTKSERDDADAKVKGWSRAIDRLAKQPEAFFAAALSAIFPASNNTNTLLAGDILPLTSDELKNRGPDVAPSPDGRNSVEKRNFFMQSFLPFLRRRLSNVFIVDTVQSVLGYERDLLETLLNILTFKSTSSGQNALDVIRGIAQNSGQLAAGKTWSGYLIPPTSDSYAFSMIGEGQPSMLVLNGRPVAFNIQSEDPTNEWSTSAVQLTAGTLYDLVLQGVSPDEISWKDSLSLPAVIPSSAILPDYSNDGTFKVFDKLSKLSNLLSPLQLTSSELSYIDAHGGHFSVSDSALDFNSLTFPHWKLIKEYVDLKNNLPSNCTSSLIDLFNWAANCDDNDKVKEDLRVLPQKISEATSWDAAGVTEVLAKVNFTTPSPTKFRNASILSKLKKLFDMSSKANVKFDLLFKWAKPHPPSHYWKFHDSAVEIQQAARSRMDPDSWNLAVRPLNDKLREHQRDSLISYLLVQDVIRNQNNINDADGLFEFFLIDVQMAPLVETSRIKQAVSTVQTYVQRCHLGLEASTGVDADVLDRSKWNWMKNYRVWEANRKIFLYPENWIDPALRDDKSEIFKNFEDDLLQKELTKDGISAALRKYAYGITEVANLVAIGLYVEPSDTTHTTSAGSKLHIFARTRLAPFKYYYRLFDFKSNSWFPWQDMGIEIPHYVVDDKITTTGMPQSTFETVGNHLVPVVWQNRLLLFVPQMMKKNVPAPPLLKDDSDGSKGAATFGDMNGRPVDSSSKPGQCWDIKMSWTEFKDGRWSPRQVTAEGFTVFYTANQTPDPVDSWLFVPAVTISTSANQPSKVTILVYRTQGATDKLAEFDFIGGQLIYKKDADRSMNHLVVSNDTSYPTSFNYQRLVGSNPTTYSELHSFQGYIVPEGTNATVGVSGLTNMSSEPSIKYPDPVDFQSDIVVQSGKDALPFYHKSAPDILSLFMSTTDLETVFRGLGLLPQMDFGNDYGVTGADFNADDINLSFNELSKPYSLYNWELGLHAPMSLIDRLLKSQQFDDALAVCHLIFDPSARGKAEDLFRFWSFPPFRAIQKQSLDEFFMQVLQPNKPNDQVTAWRDNPFSPHLIARGRPSAYMKWVVMKYIEILIAYGDYYFRMNSLESIPNAIQMYILASHLYGPRGYQIKRRENYKPQTYMNLLSKFDAFSNAMVELEEIFPFTNQTPLPIGITAHGEAETTNIFGFANTLYFAIPSNPTLTALGETIDDRLFKIRHSQDINGVTRILPLFDPPIDPALLVQATAMGLSIGSVLDDLNSPMPCYRFQGMLDRALELVTELKSLGNALISAREKKDNEALSILRAGHDSVSQILVMELKKLALDDAQKALEAQQYARKGPVYRLQHHLALAGADPGADPGVGTEFQEMASMIEKPIDEGGLKLMAYEKQEWDKADVAQAMNITTAAIDLTAGIYFLIPNIAGMGAPLGVGVEAEGGGKNIGDAIQAVTRSLKLGADVVNYQGQAAGRKASVLRNLQDRILQANIAGYEVTSIDKQILSSKIRIDMANREITNQQRAIDQAQEVEDFLKSKYSNVELYTWMEGNIRTLFYQTYTQAYDLAKQAENAYKFERPQDKASYVQNGYWDPARDGVLSGEKLYLALKQLQAAYQSKRGHDYEISKHVSLRQLSPLALISLREAGTCEFSVPEMIFDMDFPGHYLRRIKSVSITIPCVVGPCTSINSTLRLTSHKYRTDPSTAQSYKEVQSVGTTDSRFSTVYIPMQSIAVSSGDNDPGLFELNFRDERYNPFEGAGAISSWKLDLPQHVRQFAYETITDVVLHIKYTSLDGGDKLKSAAMTAVTDTITSISSSEDGLHAIFDLKNEFATGWSRLLGSEAGKSDGRILQLPNLNERLPILTRGRVCTAVDIQVLSDQALPPLQLGIVTNGDVGGDTIALGKGQTSIDAVSVYGAEGQNLKIGSWALKFEKGDMAASRVWMLVRYTLEKVK